jgi:hypothetical protein
VSFVTGQPEALMASAGNLHGVGSAMSAADGAAAAPTTGVVPTVADEVPALTATQFAGHAQMYQAVRWESTPIPATFPPIISFPSSPCACWCGPMNPSCAGLMRGR